MTQQMTASAWADEFKNQRLTSLELRMLALIAAIGPVQENRLSSILGIGFKQSSNTLAALSNMSLITMSNGGWIVTTRAEGSQS